METTITQANNPARSTMAFIVELMAAICAAEESDGVAEYQGESLDADRLRERAYERPLSVEVRTDWHSVGDDNPNPTEFRILMTWGGPAVQIVGDLDQYAQPESARIQGRDWLQPWTNLELTDDEAADLLDFCRLFYFANH